MTGTKIGFWTSVVLVLLVVPYSVIEWMDKSIPFSNNLYILSGAAIALFLVNLYYYRKRSN